MPWWSNASIGPGARCGRNRSPPSSAANRLACLAGVPVTIKECFHVAGTPAPRCGRIARNAQELAAEDSPLVKRLTAAGGIVLGKTNVPQLMVLHETDNPLYGRTNNPWNLDRSPGGSSGGEAAIIAAGGSVTRLGKRPGGSIRQPAHSTGICGLLPTQGRDRNAWAAAEISTAWSRLACSRGLWPAQSTISRLGLCVLADPTAAGRRSAASCVYAAWVIHGQSKLSQLRIGIF